VSEPEGFWDDYSSEFLFPADDAECTCDHDATDHDYASCAVDGCLCEAYWQHA
jgi:hypothetical protein